MQLTRALTRTAIGLAAAAALAAAGLVNATPARADSSVFLGGYCPGEPSVTMTTNDLGKVSVVAHSCGGLYPIEAAVKWHACIPDAENLGQTCTEAEWSYGSTVTSGTSSVSAEALFNIQDDAGFRFRVNGHWTLIDQDNHVVTNPI